MYRMWAAPRSLLGAAVPSISLMVASMFLPSSFRTRMVSYDYSDVAGESMRDMCERMLLVPDHVDPLASPDIVRPFNLPADGIDRDADNATILPTLAECRDHPGTVLDRVRPRPTQEVIAAAVLHN